MKIPNPPGLRYAAILVAFLTAFMGVNATLGAAQLWNLPQARKSLDALGDPMAGLRETVKKYDPDGVTTHLLQPEVVRGIQERRFDALEQMSGSRAFALALLSVACMFAFLSAGRILRQDGMPREATRRMLAGSLLVAAFCRTLAGAQDAAVEQKAMRVVPKLLEGIQNVNAEQLNQAMVMPVVMAGLWTAAMVGLLVLLGQYFRSEKIRQVVALQDQKLER